MIRTMLRALIVDDEPYIRKGILNKIDWNGLGIEIPAEANDGIEALDYLRENEVDIILTDIKMPEIDGIKFIELVRNGFGERHKFVIISGYGEFEYARRAMKFGVTDYLLKPIKEEELEETVRKIAEEVQVEKKEKDYRKFLESSYNNSRVILNDKQPGNLSSGERKLTGEDIVLDVKNYIEDRYFEDISLNFISQKYYIHPNYFCRIFRNIVGESFTDYLTGVRMRKARELLKRNDLKLSRISEIVGYDDPRYFSQVFKKYFGVTPSEYQSNIL